MEGRAAQLGAAQLGLVRDNVIQNEAQQLEWQANQKNVVIKLTLDENLPAVKGEESELTQVLHNIIGNAIKYGLHSNKLVLLHNESEEAYKKTVDSYVDDLLPHGELEAGLVEEMINCRWKLQRAEVIETMLLELSMAALEPKLDEVFSGISEKGKIAVAYRDADEVSRALVNIQRSQTRLSRQFRQAHDKLVEIQDRRKSEMEQDPEPEPVPAAEPAPAQAQPKTAENRPKIHVVQNEPTGSPKTAEPRRETEVKDSTWDGK